MSIRKYFENVMCFLICIHIGLIVIVPLGSKSFKRLPIVFRYYVNQIGLNTGWSLYSPNPPLDRKITVSKLANNGQQKEVFFYAPKKRLYGLNSKRELTLVKYFFQRNRMHSELWPMLCDYYGKGSWELEVKKRFHSNYITDFAKGHTCDSNK